jgi:hypothetical protein
MDGDANLRSALQHASRRQRAAATSRARLAAQSSRTAAAETAAAASARDLILAACETFGLDRLPPAVLVERLAALAHHQNGSDAAGPSDRVREGSRHPMQSDPPDRSIAVFVKISRHAASARCALLHAAGLQWNGRRGGWSGRVAPDAQERLRAEFGDRLSVDAPDPPRTSPADPPTPVPLVAGQVDREPEPPAGDPLPGKLRKARGRRLPALSVEPYASARLQTPTEGPVHRLSMAELAEVIVEIVAAEGPVDLDLIAACIKNHWRMANVDKRLREAVRAAVDLAARSRLVLIDGWPPEPERVWYHVRDAEIPIRDRSALPVEQRRWQHLPPPEIAALIARHLTIHGPTPRGVLIADVARIVGYASTSRAMTSKIDAVITRLVERECVRIEGRAVVSAGEIPTRATSAAGWRHAADLGLATAPPAPE